MGDRERGQNKNDDKEKRESGETPGAAGHPEPGSGHDDSKTVTVDDGPPVRKVDGEPGAFGEVETDRQPTHPEEAPRDID